MKFLSVNFVQRKLCLIVQDFVVDFAVKLQSDSVHLCSFDNHIIVNVKALS